MRYPERLAGRFSEVCPRCGAPVRQMLAKTLAPEPGRAGVVGEAAQQTAHAGDTPRLEALLDNIRSAWNVGSMFRTADGLGLGRLHLCGFTPTPNVEKVRKTSLGAEDNVAWEFSPDGVAHARALVSAGCRLWALEIDSRAEPLENCQRPPGPEPLVLVVGNEIVGIDPGIMALCERVVYIPMQGVKRSLNVAVAFGLAAYLLVLRDEGG